MLFYRLNQPQFFNKKACKSNKDMLFYRRIIREGRKFKKFLIFSLGLLCSSEQKTTTSSVSGMNANEVNI
jgi:hypothetical protein